MKVKMVVAVCAACIAVPALADTPEPGADATSRAADVPAPVAEEPPFKHWFVRAGPAEVIYDEGAKISVGGQQVPGASVRVKNNFTGEIEGGYYFNPNVSVSLTVCAPPTATLYGTGPLTGLKLGKVTYGPAVAAGRRLDRSQLAAYLDDLEDFCSSHSLPVPKSLDGLLGRIGAAHSDVDIEDLIAREDMVVTVSHGGYIKRVQAAIKAVTADKAALDVKIVPACRRAAISCRRISHRAMQTAV